VRTLSEYTVTVGPEAEGPWLDRSSLGHRVLHCDGSAPSLRRVSRWIRGRATGLALSSGGSKAVAHIGVIRVLREMGVTIDAIAGSSGGAVVGAALACGLEEAEMLEQLRMLAHSFQRLRTLLEEAALDAQIRIGQALADAVVREEREKAQVGQVRADTDACIDAERTARIAAQRLADALAGERDRLVAQLATQVDREAVTLARAVAAEARAETLSRELATLRRPSTGSNDPTDDPE
jgi:predicted acylesterase/phospholipase RssA